MSQPLLPAITAADANSDGTRAHDVRAAHDDVFAPMDRALRPTSSAIGNSQICAPSARSGLDGERIVVVGWPWVDRLSGRRRRCVSSAAGTSLTARAMRSVKVWNASIFMPARPAYSATLHRVLELLHDRRGVIVERQQMHRPASISRARCPARRDYKPPSARCTRMSQIQLSASSAANNASMYGGCAGLVPRKVVTPLNAVVMPLASSADRVPQRDPHGEIDARARWICRSKASPWMSTMPAGPAGRASTPIPLPPHGRWRRYGVASG